MSDRTQRGASAQERVDPAEYTEEYYLTSCEGFDLFSESGGRRLSPRLEHALELAALRPGQRVLDIACGRGEVVLHAAQRGASAVGIDYAAAATALARKVIAGDSAANASAAVAQMDATRLAFPDTSFDTVFMLDFVEHLYPPELERALDETLRVLRPSGRLIVHTSPNRLLEGVVYRRYVRHVHRAVLALAERVGYRDRLINRLMLPTSPEPPHSDYEHRLHVNEHTPGSLQRLLKERGFRELNVGFWEPPSPPLFPEWRYRIELAALDFVRFLRPFSRYPPLSRLFTNHIWISARRPA